MIPRLDVQRGLGALAAVEHAAAGGDDAIGLGHRRRRQHPGHRRLPRRVAEALGNVDAEILVHRQIEKTRGLGDGGQQSENRRARLKTAMGGANRAPAAGLQRAALGYGLAGQRRAQGCPLACAAPGARLSARFRTEPGMQLDAQLRIERQRRLQHLVVVRPDHARRGSAAHKLHIQKMVQLGEKAQRVVPPADAPLAQRIALAMHAQPAAEQMRLVEQSLHRALEQGLLQFQGLAQRRGGGLIEPLQLAIAQRLPGLPQVDAGGLLAEFTDRGQVGHDKARGGPGVDVVADKPLDQAVVEFEVGGQVLAAQARLADGLGQARVAVQAGVADGEQQRDVGVVGAGQGVFHKHIGVRVVHADALIVANLPFDRVGPVFDHAPGAGLQGWIAGVQTRLDAVVVAPLPLGLGQTRAVRGEQHHRLDQGLHDKTVFGVIRIAELQGVAQFGYPVLDLNARVHLHKEMPLAIDDALEGRYRIQAHRLAEAGRFVFHLAQCAQIPGQGGGLGLGAAGLGPLQRLLQGLDGHRHFQQLLLVHLQRAIASAQGHAPHAVADDLDFLVSRGLDIEFHEHVFVVAHARGFHFIENFANSFRGAIRLIETENALTFATAAADGLETHAIAGVALAHVADRLRNRLAQFVYRVQIDPLGIARRQHLIGGGLQGLVQAVRVQRQPPRGDQRLQRGPVRVALEQGQGGGVIDPRGDRHPRLQRRALGLVLEPGIVHGARARPDNVQPGGLHGGHHGGIFGHKAVAGEDRVVAVVAGDSDNLRDALLALGLVGAAVVGDAMHALGIADRTQFRGQRIAVHDGVLLGEKNADMRHPHLAKHIESFFADRTPTDNQRAHRRAIELPDPGPGPAAQAAIAMNQRIAQIVLVRHGMKSLTSARRRRLSGIRAARRAWVRACSGAGRNPCARPAPGADPRA